MHRSSLLAFSFCLACTDSQPGSADTGANCGPGTVLVGNVCLPDDPTTSTSTTAEAPTTSTSDTTTRGTTTSEPDPETTAAPTTTTTTTTSSTTTTATTGETIGCPGGPGEIDLHQAILFDNPPNLADWPITTNLTEVDFTSDGVHVLFSKLDGPDRWPDIVPPDWDGPLQYTLGLAECIDGQWYASAAIQFWYGLAASGGNVAQDDQIATNWYYDAARWGALAGRQPATGEILGVFVVAGNARAVHEADPLQSPVMERSNVVLVPMPDINGATHSF